MPKISVIVPVYKAEKYVGECIESILSQTYTDFELLLVDDGSPDKSGEICDYYAGKDPRIIVYHKENGGVSSARNYGIEHAVGEWICFVDSDDTILPTYLENFELDKVEADLYMQGYVRTQKGKVIDRHNFANYKGKGILSILAYSEENNIINSPCFKLFKRSIITNNDIRFDTNTSYGEDHLFSLAYVFFISCAHYSMGEGYRYRICDEESLTQRVVPYKEITYYALQAKKYHDNICNATHNNEYRSVAEAIFMTNYIRTLKYMAQAKCSFVDYKWVRDVFLPNMKIISTNKLTLKQRLIRYVTISPCFYVIIYVIIKTIQ